MNGRSAIPPFGEEARDGVGGVTYCVRHRSGHVRYFWTKPVWSWKFGEERWKPTKASGEGRGVVRCPGGEDGWPVVGLIAVSGGVEYGAVLERAERGRGVEGVGGAEGIGEERE